MSIAGSLSAQARRVADLNRTRGLPLASSPGGFTRLPNGELVFSAATNATGREPFVVPASGAPRLLVDLLPGPADVAATDFTPWRGGLVFTGTDAQAGAEPWFWIAGQAPRRIADVRPGSVGSGPRDYTSVGDTLFFLADDGTHGHELWVSDGTAAGTRLVFDVRPGAAGNNSGGLTAFANGVAFVANDGTHGSELWVSDGSAAGTRMVVDLNPGPGSGFSGFERPGELNGYLLFPGDDGVRGPELWRSDGTVAGTNLIVDLMPGGVGGFPAEFTRVGNSRVAFSATSPATGRELWFTDGTTAGTTLVELTPGVASSLPTQLTADGTGRVFFAVLRNGIYDIGVSDGTAAGSTLLGISGRPTELTAAGGVAFAATDTGALWRSDGSPAGTRMVAPNGTAIAAVSPRTLMAVAADRAYFAGVSLATGIELWESDGTSSGTRLLADLEPGFVSDSSDPVPHGEIGGRLVFSANVGASTSLFATDGTSVVVLRSSALVSQALPARCGDYLLLAATLPNGAFFVRTDGTLAGTWELTVALPGRDGVAFDATRAVFGGRPASGTDVEPWITDGTDAGTRQIADLNPTGSSNPGSFMRSDDRVFFTARDANQNLGLCVSDGTSAGTRWIQPAGSTAVRPLAPVGNGVIFAGVTPSTSAELWRSDGTLAGTSLLMEFAPGLGSTNFGSPAVLDATVVLPVSPATGAPRVVATDGQTVTQLPIVPPQGALVQGYAGRAGDRAVVLFTANARPQELWITDGTFLGTSRLPQTLPAGTTRGLVEVGTETVVCLVQPSGGATRIYAISVGATVDVRELGRVDEPLSATTPMPMLANGELFLRGRDLSGTELWAAPVGAVAQQQGLGCGGDVVLRTGAPRLGQTLVFDVRGSSFGGALGLGAPALPPLRLPAPSGTCLLHLANPLVVLPIGNSLSLAVPSDPSLAGSVIEAQALIGPFGNGGIWSNALRLRLDT